jgi:hypothetical protein
MVCTSLLLDIIAASSSRRRCNEFLQDRNYVLNFKIYVIVA